MELLHVELAIALEWSRRGSPAETLTDLLCIIILASWLSFFNIYMYTYIHTYTHIVTMELLHVKLAIALDGVAEALQRRLLPIYCNVTSFIRNY